MNKKYLSLLASLALALALVGCETDQPAEAEAAAVEQPAVEPQIEAAAELEGAPAGEVEATEEAEAAEALEPETVAEPLAPADEAEPKV